MTTLSNGSLGAAAPASARTGREAGATATPPARTGEAAA
jgi:hypothetical protein